MINCLKKVFPVAIFLTCCSEVNKGESLSEIVFSPDSQIHAEVKSGLDRWSASTGRQLSIGEEGIPVIAKNYVFLGTGPEVMYDSDPQLDRKQVCGNTLRRGNGDVVEIWISIAEPRCNVLETVAHEIGHTFGPNGTHAEEGLGAAGNSNTRTSKISASTLEWACEEFICTEFNPED